LKTDFTIQFENSKDKKQPVIRKKTVINNIIYLQVEFFDSFLSENLIVYGKGAAITPVLPAVQSTPKRLLQSSLGDVISNIKIPRFDRT
jgi:hypothetical protein